MARYRSELACYFRRRAPGQAEDLLQRTLLACVERRDHLHDDLDFRRYAYGIAWRTLLRARAGDSMVEFEDEHVASSLTGPATPEQLCEAARLRRSIHSAMTAVSPVNRRVMELYFLEGCRGREIARTLQIPAATVRSRVARGVATVRRHLPSPHQH